jgi:small subunit ribosomal protein S18
MKQNNNRRKRRKSRVIRIKRCRFCEDAILYIDFLNIELLRRYVTEKGRIIPRRITGSCTGHQKMLSQAIKRSRNIAMLP